MTANDRRQMILEALSDRREETVQRLAFEFNVSERTIIFAAFLGLFCCFAQFMAVLSAYMEISGPVKWAYYVRLFACFSCEMARLFP